MQRDYGDYGFPISTLFWGALIFVALVAFCFLAGAALRWLRNRRRLDGEAVVEGGHTKDAFTETLEEIWHSDHQTGMASTTPHETDEFPLIDKTRKRRKAIKERRKAREKAQKRQNES
jgi:hypothetical protein